MGVEVFWLLIIFGIKHVIADYHLQTPNMYLNKGQPKGWAAPLADHATVHAGMTWIIVSIFLYTILPLPLINVVLASFFATFDFVTHFIIDRWKATRKGGADTKNFWLYLGWDQFFHFLVSVLMIYVLTLGLT